MADDLSIQTASTLVNLMSQRGAQEMSVAIMKQRTESDQALASMLEGLVKQFHTAGYDGSGRSVQPAGAGSVDAHM
jgi:phosphoribosylaminoimidazole carboxylase (NCAIR synthetase)